METRAELTQQGRAANAASRHDEALVLWTRLRALDPLYVPAIEGVALSLLGLARPEEIARLAAAESGPAPAVLRAVLAQSRGEWEAALGHWRAARAAGLDRPRVTLGIAAALMRLGRATEAAQEAEAGIARGPENPALRRILAEAIEGRLALAPYTPPPGPTAVADPAALVKEFESLGRDCEFGLLQRRFGVEQLGLLRWGTTVEAALVRALAERFEGVGDPDQTEILLVEDEYRARDTRYRFTGHTTIRGDQASPESVHRKQSQRLGFLARMLVEQLDTQSRIFVYKAATLTEAKIAAIYRGVSAYGPNFLLCVTLADAAHPPGSMAVQERLMVGYIDRMGQRPDGTAWDIAIDHWLAFCRAASARRAAMLETAEPVPA